MQDELKSVGSVQDKLAMQNGKECTCIEHGRTSFVIQQSSNRKAQVSACRLLKGGD